jgi:DNA helicase II / ATP-dependent DNA helicase PcrA
MTGPATTGSATTGSATTGSATTGIPAPGPLSRARLDGALGLTLTDEQWAAVSADLDPAVIVAGAGSGKTTSMAARVAWLVASGHVGPDAVLGLTFTTKATAQLLTSMRRAVSALVADGILPAEGEQGEPIGEPHVLTYHAFAARILSEHGIRLGREPRSAVLTDGARQQLAYRTVCRTSLPLAGLGRAPVLVTKDLLSLDDELTELGVTPAQLRAFDADMVSMLRSFEPLQKTGVGMLSTSEQRVLLADLVDEWRAVKAARDVLDFPDQIRLANEIVHRYPDVVDDLRSRYAVVLLDEYQDTSIAQRVLLQRIFGSGHPVMAVGDPCQAIYGWRGASVDNIESFPQHFPPAGDRQAARFTLSQNRRSGPNILEVANRTSARLRAVHEGVEPLQPGDNGKGGGAVACALFDTYQHEVEWLVQEIERTHGGRRRGDAVAWRDIAVLAATGADLVEVDTALRRRGIPTQLVGAAALLAQPAVIELRSMLEVIHDPTANPAFVRLAVGPRWRIGARDLAALGDRAARLAGGRHRGEQPEIGAALDAAVAGTDIVESVSLSEALDDLGELDRYSPAAAERFTEMAAELRALRGHVGEPLTELILRLLRTTGLEVEAALGPAELATQQQHALHAFLELAAEFTGIDGRMTLGAFLGRLRDAERFDVNLELDVTGPADAVQLLTVHKAKGLEFGYVFVPFVAKGAFPGGQGRPLWPMSRSTVPWPLRDDCTPDLASFPPVDEGPRSVQFDAYRTVLREITELEGQRLAYVAFTRAERGLAVSGHWWGPTQSTPRGPDGFLSLVHQACLDGAGEVVHWADPPAEGDVNPQAAAASAPMSWPADPDPVRLARTEQLAAAVSSVVAMQPALPGFEAASVAAPARRTTADPSASDAERARVQEWDVLMAALLEEARSRHSTERTVELPGSVSASLLMRALTHPVEVAQEIVRPMPRPPAPAARRGTQFHAWVETRYGQQSLLDVDDLPGAADAEIGSDEALRRLQEAFERGPYADRAPVAVEAPFSLLVGGRVVSGRIDAVFAAEPGTGARYDVVDWKTGSARSVDPMQLAIYRLAWARLMQVPVEEVTAAFVIVATGEVLRPDTSGQLAELARLSR